MVWSDLHASLQSDLFFKQHFAAYSKSLVLNYMGINDPMSPVNDHMSPVSAPVSPSSLLLTLTVPAMDNTSQVTNQRLVDSSTTTDTKQLPVAHLPLTKSSNSAVEKVKFAARGEIHLISRYQLK